MLSKWIQQNVDATQPIFWFGLFTIMIILVFLFGKPKTPKSRFKVREADKKKHKYRTNTKDEFANAKYEKKSPPLLEGILAKGKPHEILGIPENSSKQTIILRYKTLMKQYHPDKVAEPGSQQWKDAQNIASSISAARDKMLKKTKN